jgi:hypothetical protein
MDVLATYGRLKNKSDPLMVMSLQAAKPYSCNVQQVRQTLVLPNVKEYGTTAILPIPQTGDFHEQHPLLFSR